MHFRTTAFLFLLSILNLTQALLKPVNPNAVCRHSHSPQIWLRKNLAKEYQVFEHGAIQVGMWRRWRRGGIGACHNPRIPTSTIVTPEELSPTPEEPTQTLGQTPREPTPTPKAATPEEPTPRVVPTRLRPQLRSGLPVWLQKGLLQPSKKPPLRTHSTPKNLPQAPCHPTCTAPGKHCD